VKSSSVLITGASTGIGRACALRLDANGWKVYAGVRNDASGEALRTAASPLLEPVNLDVTKPDQVAELATRLTAELGSSGLDGLVNNAGIAVGGPLEYLDLDELHRQFDINVYAPIAMVQAFREPLRLAKGRIVMMGSIAGRIAGPTLGPYSASKHALAALTESLRAEMHAAKIKVSLIEPGAVATPIWDKANDVVADMHNVYSAEALQRYKKEIAHFTKVMETSSKHAIDPDKVAKLVERALTSRFPKSRYLSGADARIAGSLLRVVPDRLRTVMVRKI
jgi:NAD(P)-dependent dehydrogenase (short-subunit alcohol dehydrogenase family)